MKVSLRYLGYILIISSFFRIIPFIAALIYRESVLIILITSLISLCLGGFFLLIERKMEARDTTLTLKKGLMLVAFSFVILPLISSISYLPSFDNHLLDAIFESISGFTTTGLTMYTSLDHLPKSLLLWRAETQWMGGIGIIMVFLFFFSRLRPHTYTEISDTERESKTVLTLYHAQGFSEDVDPGLRTVLKNIVIIYISYTVLGMIALAILGMPLFDSIAMSFSSVSTGGFTVSDAFYTDNLQLLVIGLLMVVGSISFITHNKLLMKKFREFLFDFEKNMFFLFMAVSMLLVFLVYTDAKVVIFQVISAFTTTGYTITQIALLPQFFIMILMIGMIIGGSMASTSGGIKVFRIYSLGKSVQWLIKKLSSPVNAVIPFKIRGKPFDESNLMILFIYFFSYFLILFGGTIIFMLLGYNFFDSSFQVTSALGTVGLQTIQLAGLHWIGKIVLIIAMLLGRLEIFPLLVLLRNLFDKF